ncbi:MAG: hypothetical protein LBN39_13570 [Planctomycetaceae bacterium]|jgi:hypothetical protein|nr:hypothetical protein [Planctomycetaceae bacterium]
MSNSPNPFSTRFWTPGVLPFRFGGGTGIKLLLQKLAERKVHQITGLHGTGKSTLLETLRTILARNGFTVIDRTLNSENRQLPDEFAVPKEDVRRFYILDGYEQLSWFDRWQLRRQRWRNTGGLLFTTHKAAFGVPVLYRTTVSFDFFLETVRKLTQNSPCLPDETFLRQRFEQYNGNFRAVFFELYDIWEQK